MIALLFAAVYGAVLALVVRALREAYRKDHRPTVVFELETVNQRDVYRRLRAIVDDPYGHHIPWRSV